MTNPIPALAADSLRPAKLLLTCSGFCHVDWRNASTDFEFICGDHDAVRVHPVLAELLSPKVARTRSSDAGADRYVFRDVSPCVFAAFDALVERLRRGQPLHVDKSNFEGLVRVSCELENDEIFSSLLGMVDLAALNVEEALKILMIKGVAAQCDELVKAVAEKFHEISEESLAAIDLETATALLSHPSLKIRDEDALYDFVRARAQNDTAFVCLFEFLYFEYLSGDRVKDFASFAREALLGNFNAVIWDRICERLVLSVPAKGNPRQPKPEKTGEEFVYDAWRPLDGIIAHLTRECGGNVHEKGVVNVSGTFPHSEYEPKQALNLGTDKYFCSKKQPGSCFCCDFKERRVTPTSYSIKSVRFGSGDAHPKSWVFEVSHDGTSWDVIDRRDNNMDLNAQTVTRNFSTNAKADASFRFIRLRQTGKNHRNDDALAFASLELFGKLSRP